MLTTAIHSSYAPPPGCRNGRVEHDPICSNELKQSSSGIFFKQPDFHEEAPFGGRKALYRDRQGCSQVVTLL